MINQKTTGLGKSFFVVKLMKYFDKAVKEN